MMLYNPKAIANYFLDLAKKDKRELKSLHILNLVYLAHGWYLAFTKAPLLSERVKADKYGPIASSLYHAMKRYGAGSVTNNLTESLQISDDFVIVDPQIVIVEPRIGHTEQDMAVRNLVEAVWNRYKQYTVIQLMKLTHDPGTPWHGTWHEKGGKDIDGTSIDNEDIQKHYETKLNNKQKLCH